jgi:hypothetical protein
MVKTIPKTTLEYWALIAEIAGAMLARRGRRVALRNLRVASRAGFV